MTPILVTGGTSALGRAVARELTTAGREIRVLSRRTGEDLVTGTGLEAALADVDTVVHLATTRRGGRDVLATRNLVDAAPNLRHLVYISIVGVDRIPIGYYLGKLAAERIVTERPHTILRTTQFHDLIRSLVAGAARLPIMPLPKLRAQPVDVRDVATRLANLTTGNPQGRAPDFGGPEIKPLRELANEYLQATEKRRPIKEFSLPGNTFRAYQKGGNLTTPAGEITFARYLTS